MPLALGFVRPAVILPAGLENALSASEVRQVVTHEYAHLARMDDWTSLAAGVAGAALALHPIARWVLRRIEREREMACDDYVVALTGMARSYARCLVRLHDFCRAGRSWASYPTQKLGAASRLGERIEALVSRRPAVSARASFGPLAVCGALIAGLVFAGAQSPRLLAFGEQAATAAAGLRFSAESVRVVPPGSRARGAVGVRVTPGRLISSCGGLEVLIIYAYNLGAYESQHVTGAPKWWDGACGGDKPVFDIQATMEPSSTVPETREMLKNLLAERFGLVAHSFTRNAPVYLLEAAPGGAKLRPLASTDLRQAKPHSLGCPDDAPHCKFSVGSGPISTLVWILGREVGRPVIDRTGLGGAYDWTLYWRGGDLDQSTLPPLQQVLRQQLGLVLVSATAPVRLLAIDRVNMPTPN